MSSDRYFDWFRDVPNFYRRLGCDKQSAYDNACSDFDFHYQYSDDVNPSYHLIRF